jgi:hypothetical protein
MTYDETLDLLSGVRMLWPHSELGEPEEAAAMWHAKLAPFDLADAEGAIQRLADAGREHAPLPGVVVHALELDRQGDAPSFEDMQLWLSRHSGLLPYGQSNTPQDTAVAVARLAQAGAHEAVLRFVAAQGVFAVRMMPDPALHGLGLNENADRRDLARDYRGRVLPQWRDDPAPGRALERVCRGSGLDPGELTERAALELDEQRQRLEVAQRPELPAGEEPDEPMVDFDPAELHAQMKVERQRAAAEREERLLAQRREEAEARRAAQAELAEHARRRGSGG